ncbi:hypothetical protein [Rhodococcus coprophilus]|nr:hypothetical protein [Rhodococcus coprophilus]MBM7460534.1 hypothetical protein [Rhodococcus coprophilus]
MTAVKWDEVAHRYEDIASVLLSTLHPSAQRIDGAGGDGGRDVQIKEDGELHIFECKSFTGRLGWQQSRRSQVEKSLKNAMAHQPDSWTLVVPIDHTPEELKWFDSLKEKYDLECPIYWLGKDWLNKQMAEHPAIIRYFIDGANDEVVRLLRELNQEQATFENLSSGLERLRNLANRLNEIDPYYKINISIIDGEVSLTHVPRWNGADQERPITFSMNFNFPDSEIGKLEAKNFRDRIDRGEAVTVDGAYAKIISASGAAGISDLTGKSVNVRIGSTRAPIAERIDGRIVISDPHGLRKATLPIQFRERQIGRRVATIYGHDRTDSVHVAAEVEPETAAVTVKARIKVEFQPKSDLYPHELLTVLKFGYHLRAPNRIDLELGNARPVGYSVQLECPSPVPSVLIELVERLARIQSTSNTPFPSPVAFSDDQRREIDIATRLLDGERIPVSGPARFTSTLEFSKDDGDGVNISQRMTEKPMRITLSEYRPVPVCGEQVYLGFGVYECRKTKIENIEEAIDFMNGRSLADAIQIALVPIDDDPIYFRLLQDDDPEELRTNGQMILDV